MAKQTHTGNDPKDLDIGEVYTKTELFLERNKQAVTIGVVGLLVVVGGLLGWRKFVAEPKAREAAELAWKAQYYFEIDSLDRAMMGDDMWPGFVSLADDYGSTPTGKLAHYYLGAIHMKKGEYEAAIDEYGKADVDDDVLRAMAIGGMGDAYVELGRTDEAVKQFEKAAGLADNAFTTPMFLMKAGILYKQGGDWNKAAQAFERIAKEYPSSAEANSARKYLGMAEAMAG